MNKYIKYLLTLCSFIFVWGDTAIMAQDAISSYTRWNATSGTSLVNNQIYGDHFKYLGGTLNYQTSPAVNVRGVNVGTHPIVGRTNSFGFKVKAGIKGYVNVFYADASQIPATPDMTLDLSTANVNVYRRREYHTPITATNLAIDNPKYVVTENGAQGYKYLCLYFANVPPTDLKIGIWDGSNMTEISKGTNSTTYCYFYDISAHRRIESVFLIDNKNDDIAIHTVKLRGENYWSHPRRTINLATGSSVLSNTIGITGDYDFNKTWSFSSNPINLNNYTSCRLTFSENLPNDKIRVVFKDGNDRDWIGTSYSTAGSTTWTIDFSQPHTDSNSAVDKTNIISINIQDVGGGATYIKPTEIKLIGKGATTPATSFEFGTSTSESDPAADFSSITLSDASSITDAKVKYYQFDLTSSTTDQQYWLTGTANIASIEVIHTADFSANTLLTMDPSVVGTISWSPSSDNYIKTYIESNRLYIDGADVVLDNGRNPVLPLNNSITATMGGTSKATIPLFIYNSISMKVEQGKTYTLKLYYISAKPDGDTGIYPIIYIGNNLTTQSVTQNGTPGLGDNATATYQYTFTIPENGDNIVRISANGYLRPLNLAGFELYAGEPVVQDDPDAACVKGSDVTLYNIDSHYLWKGTSNLTAGDTDNASTPKIVYRGNGASYITPSSETNTYVDIDNYTSNNGTVNQGTNGIYRADAHDHWAMKVKDGKIGIVKVYYKANHLQFDYMNLPGDRHFDSTNDGSITFSAAWEWKNITYLYDAVDYSGYQYLKVEFLRPTIVPMRLTVNDADDNTAPLITSIPAGSTECFVYIGEGSGFNASSFKHLFLQPTSGFGENDFIGNSVDDDTDNAKKTHTIKVGNIYLLEAPVILRGTSENVLPENDSNSEYLIPTLELRSNGTEVLTYGFNHEAENAPVYYWVNGVASVVRVGAIEVTFDEKRIAATFDRNKLTTTRVNSIPEGTEGLVTDSDGHKTLQWRVKDYSEMDNGSLKLFTNNYYQPAGGSKYYQYIYNGGGNQGTMDITLQSNATTAGSADRDKSTIYPTNNLYAQAMKLEPNTMYRIKIYTVKGETQLMRFVNKKGLIGSNGKLDILGDPGLPATKVYQEGITTIEFVTGSDEDNCYFWILGRNDATKGFNNYVGFDLTYIQPVTDQGSTNTYEETACDGTNGAYYLTVANNQGKAFPYSPRAFAETDGVFYPNTESNQLKLKEGSTLTMDVMLGTDGTYIWRTENDVQGFYRGGLKWKTMASQSNNGGFLDGRKTYTAGDHNKQGTEQASGNANPQTECNGGIGGQYTEDGGMFLQPVSGDFFRFEPKYDGIVTVWFLQNGNTDGDTYQTFDLDGSGNVKTDSNGNPILEPNRGNLTRRPVYVVDENGVIMRQSTVKPHDDYSRGSHYSVNGTWAHINDFAWVRDDFSKGWQLAIERWKDLRLDASHATTYTYNGKSVQDMTSGLADRYKETLRFYNGWYDGGTYDYNTPDEHMTLNNITVHDTNLTGTVNTANSSTDNRTTYVNQTQLTGMIIYRSDRLRTLENGWNCTNTSFNQFAKYGYEVPVHLNVRYIIPVRAGKTYYIGGRGTKNGFSSVKFEPMPANYNPADYVDKDHNYTVSYPDAKNGKYELAYITSSGSHAADTYSATTNIATYTDVPVLTVSDAAGIVWTDKNNSALSSVPAVGTTVHAKSVRTFTANKWHPIVLPFSVSESKMRELFGEGVKVLYLDPYDHSRMGTYSDWISVYAPAVNSVNDSENTLHFTRHYYQMLYANTPAFVCPSTSISNPDFGYVNYAGTTINSYDIGGKYKVTGSYTATDAGSGPMYYVSNSQEDSNFKAIVYHSTTGVAMKPGRVWIAPNQTGVVTAPLKTVSFGSYDGYELEGEEQAGIEDIVMDDIVVEKYNDDFVYDMMGRIVGKDSTDGLRTGVYIFHGRKVYIR